jgi:hypothetical protein
MVLPIGLLCISILNLDPNSATAAIATKTAVSTFFTGAHPTAWRFLSIDSFLMATLADTVDGFSLDLHEFHYSSTTGSPSAIPAVSLDG